MARQSTKRKDKDRIVLRKGECQRPNGRYDYRWTDQFGKRHVIYGKTLEELREKEKEVDRDISDGIKAEKRNTTINELFDLWCHIKRGMKDNTFQNYKYMYNTFVRPKFGKLKISQVKKSDVKRFYNYLADERGLQASTIDSIHTVLHQVFDLAVDDGYIRSNLSERVLKELKQAHCFQTEKRKALSRKISLLKEAGIDIESRRAGSYLEGRDIEDSELKLLIASVLCSKHITAKHSKDLIDRLCGLSNKYFRSHVKNIYSVNDWSKTDNQALFFNIELIDTAIEQKLRVAYDYNKIGIDKKLHKSSYQVVSPYQLILHNQRYYLMAYSEYWGNMVFHRLDRITNMKLTEEKATDLQMIPGYKNGIDYKKLSSAMPYMYSDEPERIDFVADAGIVDQIVDWFGNDIRIAKSSDNENQVKVSVVASPNAMEHWAMQYASYIEVVSPKTLRERIKNSLENGLKKYK